MRRNVIVVLGQGNGGDGGTAGMGEQRGWEKVTLNLWNGGRFVLVTADNKDGLVTTQLNGRDVQQQ